MATFAYRAKNQRGGVVEGRYEATDQDEALRVLRGSGLSVLNIRTEGASLKGAVSEDALRESVEAPLQAAPHIEAQRLATSSQNAPTPSLPLHDEFGAPITRHIVNKTDFWARANSKEMSLFFRQLHAMLNAGMSSSRALKNLSQHAPNVHLRRAADAMSRQTGEGQKWSSTMRAYPGIFSPLMMSMIEAGERGGFVVPMCQRIADYCERDFQLEQSIKRETFYPKILVFAAIFIPSVVTLVLNGFDAWLAQVLPTVSLIAIGFVAWKVWSRVLDVSSHTHFVPLLFDTIKLYIPKFGGTTRALATAKFCRALGTLYAAGVGPRHAFLLAGAACGNRRVGEETRKLAPMLENGASYSELFARTRLFSPLALQMLAVGEESGDIDKQLDKTANFLESEAETSIRQNVKIAGVLIFLFTAGYIASIVGSMYQGYINEVTKLIE